MALTSSTSNSGGGEPSVTTTTAPLSSTPARGRYLSARGLQRLKDYKYVSAPLSSYIDQKMTHFWEFTVNLMPMWLASVDRDRQRQRQRGSSGPPAHSARSIRMRRAALRSSSRVRTCVRMACCLNPRVQTKLGTNRANAARAGQQVVRASLQTDIRIRSPRSLRILCFCCSLLPADHDLLVRTRVDGAPGDLVLQPEPVGAGAALGVRVRGRRHVPLPDAGRHRRKAGATNKKRFAARTAIRSWM